MRILIVLYMVVWSAFAAQAQDINFGFNFGTNPYNKYFFKYSSDWYTPPRNAYIYNATSPGTGIIVDQQKFFNAYHFGASMRISRKKIGINLEPQMYLEYAVLNFTEPYKNSRVLNSRGYRIPIYLTYHLFNNPLALHINAGLIIGTFKFNDYSLPDLTYYVTEKEPYGTTENTNTGDNHFYEVFYDEKTSSFSKQYMLGFGKRVNKLDYNLRYVNHFGNDLLGQRWQIELHVNFFFISKEEFKAKNYLYEE